LRIDLPGCNKGFFLDIDTLTVFFHSPLFLHVATVSQVQSWGKHTKGICNEPVLVNDSNVWSQGISSLALPEVLSFYFGGMFDNMILAMLCNTHGICSVLQGTK